MTSVLEQITIDTRARVAERKQRVPIDDLRSRASARASHSDFVAALRQPGVGIIAEIKRGSPSKGVFAPDLVPAELARTYQQIGAVAVSVLTSPDFFATDDDLTAAACALNGSGLPLLRKEFHIDPYQVAEAASLGADAYLLIAKTLSPAELAELVDAGTEFALPAFIEVTDEAEVQMALDAGAPAIGINNRNLHNFTEDLSTTERLRAAIPPHIPVVAASGVRSRDDMRRMEESGVDAVLIGEALASSPDPAAKMRELRGS